MVNMMPNFSMPGMSGQLGGGASALSSMGSIPGMSGGGLSGLTGGSGLAGLGSMGGMSGIGGGAPGMDAGSLQQMGVSSSTLMLMSQINMMMASVMTGLMAFMQQVMASAAQRQQQGPTAPGMTPGGSPGATSGAPSPGGGNPGKPGGGGTSSGGGSPGGPATSTMEKLAKAGKDAAMGMGGYTSGGKCATGVTRAIQSAMGISVTGNGNDFDSSLPASGKFHKVNISLEEALKTPGYVVTWEKTSTTLGSKYGHVAVTLGDGKSSASDFIESNTVSGSSGRTGMTIWAPN